MIKRIIIISLIFSFITLAQPKEDDLEFKFLVIVELIKLESFDSAASDLKSILKKDSLNAKAIYILAQLYENAAAKSQWYKCAHQIMFELAYRYYSKASETEEYGGSAKARMDALKTMLFTGDDYFGEFKKETITLADDDCFYWVDEEFTYDQEYFRKRAIRLGIK